jgi:phospholipase/carboxylesterase
MGYALALGPERPAPAGIMVFSGFIPTVEGWSPRFEDRGALRAFVAHGDRDPVIDVAFGRSAHETLLAGGLAVDYREFAGGHEIPPAIVPDAQRWLSALPLR